MLTQSYGYGLDDPRFEDSEVQFCFCKPPTQHFTCHFATQTATSRQRGGRMTSAMWKNLHVKSRSAKRFIVEKETLHLTTLLL